jgi:hypothetical protein
VAIVPRALAGVVFNIVAVSFPAPPDSVCLRENVSGCLKNISKLNVTREDYARQKETNVGCGFLRSYVYSRSGEEKPICEKADFQLSYLGNLSGISRITI